MPEPLPSLHPDLSHLTLDSTLADLPTHHFQVSSLTMGQVIAAEFEKQRELPGVIVVEEDKVVGAFSRRKFLERVGRPYGVEVYLNRPVSKMLQAIAPQHLTLPGSCTIHLATQAALNRDPSLVYEPIVVEFPDHTARLLNVYILLLAQSQLMNLAHNAMAEMYELEQKRRHWAEALEEVGRTLASHLDITLIPEMILNQLARVVPYERGSILMRKDSQLYPLAHRGFPENEQTDKLRISIIRGDIFQQIAQTGTFLIIDDVRQEQGWQQLDWLPEHRSWLGAPLIAKDKIVGFISLTRAGVAAFNHDDALLVQAFARQAASVLENARLYDEISQLNEQLEQKVLERTEELNRAYRTLERMDKAKSDFISVTSHELRTPITVISGYTQMLKVILPNTNGTSGARELVEGILNGTQRMHEVVNTMLDVSKIDQELLEIHREEVTLAVIMERVCLSFEPALAERHLTLTVHPLESLPPFQADGELLLKVFDNLVVNAIKYTPDGGQITINGRLAEEYIEVVVEDSGVGIEPQQLELIFEKFYQTGEVALHSSGKTKFKGGGPGLGLAIAKGVVAAHGGQIWAESEGHSEAALPGSRFFVRLPLG
jgi:signal transduction histidine kinase